MVRPHLRPFRSVDQQLLLPNLVLRLAFMSIAMEKQVERLTTGPIGYRSNRENAVSLQQ